MVDTKSTSSISLEHRYDHFQIMRGVACLMVFLNHVLGLLSRGLPATGAWYEPLIVPMGFPWVWLFLILSGFLLTKQFVDGRATLSKAGVAAFYERRAWRLVPMLWFVPLLFGILYGLGIWSPDLPDFVPSKEISVALALPWVPYLATWNPVASVNSPVWSAVLEVHYFVALPFILWWTKMSTRWMLAMVGLWMLGVVALCALILATGSPSIFPMIYQQHLYNGGFMLAGCVIALLRLRPLRRSWFWPILTVAAAMIGAQYLVAYDLNLALALLPIPMLPALSFLVIQGNSDFQAPIPSSWHELGLYRGLLRWIELTGMMSYSFYLLHKPLAYIAITKLGLVRYVTDLTSLAVATITVSLITYPLVILIFSSVENHFRRRDALHRLIAPLPKL